jgi:hypothetical protein
MKNKNCFHKLITCHLNSAHVRTGEVALIVSLNVAKLMYETISPICISILWQNNLAHARFTAHPAVYCRV